MNTLMARAHRMEYPLSLSSMPKAIPRTTYPAMTGIDAVKAFLAVFLMVLLILLSCFSVPAAAFDAGLPHRRCRFAFRTGFHAPGNPVRNLP